MTIALLVLLATLPTTITNTQEVRDLAPFGDRMIACTGGGLDVFDAHGQWLRPLHREDGLPSNACHALAVVDGRLLVATEEGVAALDPELHVQRLLDGRWEALPPSGTPPALPTGPTYTAFSASFAGTADGRVIRIADHHLWSVYGAVRVLRDSPLGLEIGTSEARYRLTPAGLTELPPVGKAPFWYTHASAKPLELTGADGHRFTFDGAPLSPSAPTGTRAWRVAFGKTWAGTSHGLFTREGRAWMRRTPSRELCGNHITAITRYRGRLVIGTFAHGACWQEASGAWSSFRAPALPSDHVLGLASDGTRLFVATEYGLGVWDGTRWTQMSVRGRNPYRLRRLSVLGASALGDGEVALFDGLGTSYVRAGHFERRVELPRGWARHPSVVSAASGSLWYGSEDRGVLRHQDGALVSEQVLEWSRAHDGNSLTDNWVTALQVDASGRAVVGSCQNGFAYFDGRTWTRVPRLPGMPSADVTAVALTQGGALIGTLLGLVRYDAANGSLTAVPGPTDPQIASLLVEPNGVWVGTQGGLSWIPAARERRGPQT